MEGCQLDTLSISTSLEASNNEIESNFKASQQDIKQMGKGARMINFQCFCMVLCHDSSVSKHASAQRDSQTLSHLRTHGGVALHFWEMRFYWQVSNHDNRLWLFFEAELKYLRVPWLTDSHTSIPPCTHGLRMRRGRGKQWGKKTALPWLSSSISTEAVTGQVRQKVCPAVTSQNMYFADSFFFQRNCLCSPRWQTVKAAGVLTDRWWSGLSCQRWN